MVIKASMLQKLIDNNKALAGKLAGRPGLVFKQRVRYPVHFNGTTQKLHVGEGSVAWHDTSQPDSVTRPFIPKLDGVSLSENPGWDVSGKSTGTEYEVICLLHGTAGRMVLHEKDGEEELEKEDGEVARLIATVTFESGPNGLQIEELNQKWQDDIEHGGGDYSSSSGGSEESQDDSDNDSIDDGSTSDDSDSSGSGSSSSSGSCCPAVTIESAIIMMVGSEATMPPEDWTSTAIGYSFEGVAEDTLIYVSCNVEPPTGSCAGYKGRLWLAVSVGGVEKKVYLGGGMSGQVSTEHVISATACSTRTVTACIEVLGAPVSEDVPPLVDCCAEELEIAMPAVIGETCP